LKKPPPSPLISLIASCAATGPQASTRCAPPSAVASGLGASVGATPCQTVTRDAMTHTGVGKTPDQRDRDGDAGGGRQVRTAP
jgi:hypothetical protein